MVLAHFATAAVAFANATLTGSGLDGQYGCSPYYGSFVSKRDCLNAIDQLPWGAVERTYTVDKNPILASRHLPMARESGDCMVQIEMAGPYLPATVDLVPAHIVDAARRILDACGSNQRGFLGGFVTGSMTNLREWITSPEGELGKRWPDNTSFPTITISNSRPEYLSPGNYDPDIAHSLANFEFTAAKPFDPESPMVKTLIARGR
ncbi:MAG: hypothetical protein Q9183_006237, partial [Haloplaca sp. 2 TL-2023]